MQTQSKYKIFVIKSLESSVCVCGGGGLPATNQVDNKGQSPVRLPQGEGGPARLPQSPRIQRIDPAQYIKAVVL